MPGQPRVTFLNAVLRNPLIEIGDYTYYDDPDGPEAFERNVLYHYPFVGDRLVIGRFCAIATGATFIMNGANHRLAGLTTYPFTIYDQSWSGLCPEQLELAPRGATVIGNDVWIGRSAVILPGVTIGDGAVIGAHAVVSRPVRPYAVVAGNPAREVRRRLADDAVERMLRL